MNAIQKCNYSILFSKKNIYLFIWLHCVLVAVCELLIATCGVSFPDQGSNPDPLHWEYRVLATGPPGKSLNKLLN